MRRTLIVLVAVLSLFLAPALANQKKPKDEFTYQYLVGQFRALNAKVDKINLHLTALDAEVGLLKQQQKDLDAELRDDESVSKTIDTSLDSLNLSSQQDFLGLKTELAYTRQDIAALSDLVKSNAAAAAKSAAPAAPAPAPAPAAAPAPPPPALEGYITAADANGVTIDLGSNAGVKVGAQFSVYKSSDSHTEVGVIEVTQVTDANNSRAKIVFIKPGIQFEFSDTVRLK